MLHLYLLYARFRCFDAETAKAYQQQILDQFFFESEALMEIQHGMYSPALRQRYLKDLFIQWRGLILSYDEGIIKGDAELASAVWRNVFKAKEEVDPVALAGVVAWIRMTLRHLEQMEDEEILLGKDLFARPLEEVMPGVKKDLEVQARMRSKRTAASHGDASSQAPAAAPASG
jgi:cytochrome b pre-mRNA-processing protein 3